MRDFDEIKDYLREFAEKREWTQFHSPKNLAMALSVEVAELLEHFQWLTEEQSKNIPPEKLQPIADEIADVQLYLIRLADQLNVNILQAIAEKTLKNEAKYPVEKVKGSAKKYDEY
jgi:dCTP diphosphatase